MTDGACDHAEALVSGSAVDGYAFGRIPLNRLGYALSFGCDAGGVDVHGQNAATASHLRRLSSLCACDALNPGLCGWIPYAYAALTVVRLGPVSGFAPDPSRRPRLFFASWEGDHRRHGSPLWRHWTQ